MRSSKRARDNVMDTHTQRFIEEFGECPKRNGNAWFRPDTPESGYRYFGLDTYGKVFQAFEAEDALEQIGLKCEICTSETNVSWDRYFSMDLCPRCERGMADAEVQAESDHP